jgi:hypothetical protein
VYAIFNSENGKENPKTTIRFFMRMKMQERERGAQD